MNRRSFIKRFVQAAAAVAVAPPILSELMPMHAGGIVPPQMNAVLYVGEPIIPCSVAMHIDELRIKKLAFAYGVSPERLSKHECTIRGTFTYTNWTPEGKDWLKGVVKSDI